MKRTIFLAPSLLSILALAVLAASPLGAISLPCQPCGGIRVIDPDELNNTIGAIGNLAAGTLEPGSPLFVAWDLPLDGSADPGPAAELFAAGATPWMTLVFRTPAPLTQNLDALQAELGAAAKIAAAAPAGAYFQIAWRPESGVTAVLDPAQYGFLIKRAAVVLTGAAPEGKVATGPLPPDPAFLTAFYAEEIAAYLEAVALAPAAPEQIAAAVAKIDELDPGRPVVLDALPVPVEPGGVLTAAAKNSTAGLGLTLFATPAMEMPEGQSTQVIVPPGGTPASTALPALVLLAREFAGDLSYDPTSTPTGAEAWAFVRGKDLGVRVIAATPPGTDEVALLFPDAELRRPVRYSYFARKAAPPSGKLVGGKLEVRLAAAAPVEILALERPTAAEREGVEEKVTVSGDRGMTVEEVLRRLQAFEDAQNRRIDHYQAVNTTSLRFPAAGTQSIEATLEGPYFVERGVPPDWVWSSLYLNGVRWRSKSIPEIPLIQPEKAATMPGEITFDKKYRYTLRGSDTIDGRAAWVVDFEPVGAAVATEGRLYKGTVWVDKQLSSRLKTRAVQLGLVGEVLSNEETLLYSPIDADGAPAPWAAGSFILPLKVLAQQILSVVNTATIVERDTRLTEVKVNADGFAEARTAANASDATIVRDTAQGLRYMVKDDKGERVVKEGFDHDKLFLAGGLFYDDSFDYPLPLAGINYFSLDFKGTKQQVNVFFGGLLLVANVAQPRLFGSKFDFGADAFALAISGSDQLFRDNREVPAEEVKSRPASFTLNLGHPVGNFFKWGVRYGLVSTTYSKADTADRDFSLPSNNIAQRIELSGRYARAGYRLDLGGSYHRRSKWEPWGLPGNLDFDPDKKDYLRWQASLTKTWNLPKFTRFSAEVDYLSGSDLDRFSKYEFGFFGASRVHGYQSNRVRATDVSAAHVTYGFAFGDLFRLDLEADAAWATDEDTGLHNELLGGAGIAGTFIGPWKTVVNLDVGVPVAGPDDGVVLYVVFLKLFK
ncbi:MAG TPA: hypothetical protein VN851_08760 [Thermoanaerobaculia bacterium]|nr:hypothetical protein [Thermoanaerobaculia bacterium]